MSTKYLIFVLSTILLAQFTHGYVAAKKSDSKFSEETNKVDKKEASSEEDDNLAVLGVVVTALSETAEVLEATYSATRKAFQPLIASLDATGNAAKSDLEAKIVKVKELFEKTDKLSELDGEAKTAFIDEITNIFGGSLKETKIELGTDASDLDKNFVQAKETLQAEGRNIFKRFSDNIIHAAEEYWNSLSAKKREEQKSFYDNLEKIKNEPDLDKRVEQLQKAFFSIDSSEEKE